MRVAIVSDSHDHVWNLQAVVAALAPADGSDGTAKPGAGGPAPADALIHCGDLSSPFIVPMLAKFGGPVHAVFGNNDADRFRLQANAAKTANVTLHGEFAELDLDGLVFAAQHFDAMAKPLAESCRFDVVCFGHNHRRELRRIGEVWLVNPGALMGWRPGGDGDVPATFTVFDTRTKEFEWWRVADGRVAPDEAP